MAKYSQEFKLEVVQYYLSGFGKAATGQKFSVDHMDVQKWVTAFEQYGISGLSVKTTKSHYSQEFKFQVVQSLLNEGLSAKEASQRFHIREKATILQWLNLYHEYGIDGLKAKPKGRAKQMPKPQRTRTQYSQADRDKTQEQLLEELAYLRAEVALLKKRRALRLEQEAKEAAEQQRAELISGLRQDHELKHLLHAAQMARSTYFYHEQQRKLEDKYSDLKQQIKAIYHQHKGRYGYRRITLALRNMGRIINHKCVQRLMQSMQLKSRIRVMKYRSYKGQVSKIVDNVLQRQFKADRPNLKWATDVTEFNVRGEKLYLSPVIDLFNGEIIAFQTQRRPHYALVKNMLDTALGKLKPDDKPLLHSDQGWQYQMRHYQQQLKQHGLTQSMSRKGNCLDNAVMESFFGILKSECFYGEKFNSVDELEQTVKEYIHYYNHERIKVKLKGLSPVQYRTQSLKAT
ncbi:IS3 family transposase [Acinetobacter haemolyticus]|uniref:IS3 family transposase n=5 Tax=Acinetobacter haemolyticus TaxID=29430 RepID=A0A4P7B6I9_ACIHA|nr:IS3 family transposase [Acinetobacter haemolyticus]QBQ17352.1 IS3 family transposase [Acinetobacter haemolyticus]